MNTLINFLIPTAEAHVGYVIDHSQIEPNLGTNWPLLFKTLATPFNIGLILITLLVVLGVWHAIQTKPKVRDYFDTIGKRASTYKEFVPWILRLSLGLSLLGAAGSNVLISPLLPYHGIFIFIELVFGFALLFGFMTTPVAIGTSLLYLFALSQDTYIMGNMEVLGASLALLGLSTSRPGFDDLLNIGEIKIKWLTQHVYTLLRFGLGIAMTYLALFEKILNPNLSQLVVAKFHLMNLIPVSSGMWVLSTGIIELVIGICLLLNFKVRTISVVAFIVLIVTFFGFNEAVFAHVTLFGVLSALLILGNEKE